MNFEQILKSQFAKKEKALAVLAVSKEPQKGSESIDPELMLFEAIEQAANANYRSMGMSAVLTWADIGSPNYDDFESMAVGLADVDENGEVTEEEEEEFNEILFAMTQALKKLGVKSEIVSDVLAGDDSATEKAMNVVSDFIENTDLTDAEIIASFAVEKEAMTEAKKKVIRDGVVKWVNVPLRKKRMSAKQRAALKRARMKANTGAAKAKRAKAMKMRKSRGL